MVAFNYKLNYSKCYDLLDKHFIMALFKKPDAAKALQAPKKQRAGEKAIDYIPADCILGVGTGSTVHFFIEALKSIKGKITTVVSSSKETTQRLRECGFYVEDLNSVSKVDVYVDGADEVTPHKQMIKGGGAALTGEKIIAACAQKFICIADDSKQVDTLGKFPLPIEVIPMARSFVARELVNRFGAHPEYRIGTTTDYGNIILDVHGLQILNPTELEQALNQIPGVVTNGLFAQRGADLVLIGTDHSVKIIE